MAEAFLSRIWYRVSGLTPRLRSHVTVHRHRYRGQPWYVLQDHSSGRVHRFTPAAYMVMGRFDGQTTIDRIWNDLAETYDADAPSQDEVIQLLATLHQNDLIQHASNPDVADLLERYRKKATEVWKQNLSNPVSVRVPLWDPDRFLTRTLPVVRLLTGWWGLILWAVVVAWGGLVGLQNYEALTTNFTDQLLGAQNLMISIVSYPLLKALHELAHGYLTKVRGGDVREMGIMFLVFFPVPYVDASAAAAFRNKWHRAAVSAGGIMVETFVAALAVLVWVELEPGFLRAVCFNLIAIGGLSTLVVNGNPLLKFDGYYVMSDLIESPNFGTRANRYWGYLIQKRLFRARQLKAPSATWGEKVWFTLYAPAALVYRLVVMIGIALFVAGKYYFIGILIAAWSVFNAVVKPMFKHIRHVLTSPSLRKVRSRAKAWTFGGMGLVALILLALPLPLRTDTEGVVWLPEAAHVRARAPGFLQGFDVARGAEVAAGAPLAALEAPTQDARIDALRWRNIEYERRLSVLQIRDRGGAELARLELEEARGELSRELARVADMTVRAPLAGRFEPVSPEGDILGRFFAEGDLIGYVLPPRPEVLRVAVPQADIALVRERLRGVEVRLAGRLEQRLQTQVLRTVPQASTTLPSAVLGSGGGGRFLTAPTDEKGLETTEPVFLYDLAVPDALADTGYGTRVHVRFDLGMEPLGFQIGRRVRQLFLDRFNA
ncbi:PqqD family peptide modification chaperone [Roseisalinus antarcticus]|uniref:Coenzyme PQQ synthesis protein D n=1 Tax=Roseisalinus antarcticus TaxID=254357 RepID=A0A1Y5SI77_9RHOB|nr:PqqD family peptide modification chaperone [Roseisalinus antarcticus]SLN40712.1 Coenzyme PQQ synthesis protein D [Roseisalinus antarcticus]